MGTTYLVKLTSRSNSIVLFVFLAGLFFFGAKAFIPPGGLHHGGLSVVITISFFLIAYWLWQLFVVGKTAWTISGMGVSVVWQKKFLLPEKEYNLTWNEIAAISQSRNKSYDLLKIKLNSGGTKRFYHGNTTFRDDYKALVKALLAKDNHKKTTG